MVSVGRHTKADQSANSNSTRFQGTIGTFHLVNKSQHASITQLLRQKNTQLGFGNLSE
ncbi:hypothetical protein Fmac_006074 [Flemingia macrophylla]|uniref:Uncharacterized protein n=1 Tax=Flemingia macrophylla TaxID=520843 RepID=A0ABD1N9Q2_9FABA